MLRLIVPASIALLSLPVAFAADATPATPVSQPPLVVPSLYIVQAPSVESAEQSVEHVAGSVEQPLEIIHAVSAYLTLDQAEQLRQSGLHVYADRKVATRGLFSFLSSLTAPVTSTVGKVAAPVATPVLNAAAPLTTPLTQALAPVTSPVLNLATPLAGENEQLDNGPVRIPLLFGRLPNRSQFVVCQDSCA